MFQQAAPSVNWTSNADPETLVPVGPDALAMQSNNIVVCFNLKTQSRSYFKGDSPQTCAGISLIAGHLRYPIFAVCESVLRPRIFIISYPDMEKLSTIQNRNIVSYVDMVFSEYDYLVTLGDYPDYKLSFWDKRLGYLIAEEKTHIKCTRYSLCCIRVEDYVVMQYCKMYNKVLVWELCLLGGKPEVYEISTIILSNNFMKSNFCQLTYFEHTMDHIINDYGELFLFENATRSLRHVWSTPKRTHSKHSLFFNKNGVMIINTEEIYFIKSRPGYAREWDLEWTLPNPDGYFKKMVSDHYNNMHVAATNGNIYRVQYEDEVATFIPELIVHCYVMDFVLLKGIKDEVVLLLIDTGEVRLVDLIRMNSFSKITMDNASSIAAHNTLPYVAIGTRQGKIHFINYEKPKAPVEIGSVQFDNFSLSDIRLYDDSAFIKNDMNGIHIMMNDYRLKKFDLISSLARERFNSWTMLDMFLIDEQRAIVFLSLDYLQVEKYADQAWVYTWKMSQKSPVKCTVYELPDKYRCFTVTVSSSPDIIEFMGVRVNSLIIDSFVLSSKNGISIVNSLRTVHFAHICCISGNRNILTAGSLGVVIHFRIHKKSKHPYVITRALLNGFVSKLMLKVAECFNGKYLLNLGIKGLLSVFRLPILGDNLRENKFVPVYFEEPVYPSDVGIKTSLDAKSVVKTEATELDLIRKEEVVRDLNFIAKAITELVDYDMSVIGFHKMNFQKFCLNHVWLKMIKEESRILYEAEHSTLLNAISDQSRIRDWILDLIKSKSSFFSTKLYSIFSHIYVESYSTHASTKELLGRFDLFRFYEMEPLEDDMEELADIEDKQEGGGDEQAHAVIAKKALKRYVLEKGANVYEHVMAKDFELQDHRIVTFNQMYNEDAKQMIILTDALKAEFNKNFSLSKNFKEEIMENVHLTNATLQKIHSNMNCMLCLLKMEQFTPPELSVPEWKREENIQKILTGSVQTEKTNVDDSEVKAINRRKKIIAAAAHKSGRMLLWSNDFWKRALMAMMDGVLEKLWEEEIKKTPQPPEVLLKKQPHEYNLEDQKLQRQYDALLKALEEDRKKYLRILRDNESKTFSLKKHFVLKLNEHIAEINIEKLKYDFAIKHERLRLLNIKLTNFKRIECKQLFMKYRDDATKLTEYISKYEKLNESFELRRTQSTRNHESQVQRDRQLERQFKGQYLNTIPMHLTAEMTKIYKRRPKIVPKIFHTTALCDDIANRLVSRKIDKFPIAQELVDFLDLMKSLDKAENCPPQLDAKYWDMFTKLRRQKLESELRLKGLSYIMSEMPKARAYFTDELRKLEMAIEEKNNMIEDVIEEYFDVVHNQSLELVLTMGQVEIAMKSGKLDHLRNGVLMHVNDIENVNMLIKEAGLKKIKSMQRVAAFRRQVIYKEWEHKIEHANIDYLRYILKLVRNCKINYEFLEVLRNWHRVKELKATTTKVGLLEEYVEKRLAEARKRRDRLDKRITEVRERLEEMKRRNRLIDSQVDNLKSDVAYQTAARDVLSEEKTQRVNSTRMKRAMQYGMLSQKVRGDYVKILELTTILNITRWHTFEMLPPIEPLCLDIDIDIDE